MTILLVNGAIQETGKLMLKSPNGVEVRGYTGQNHKTLDLGFRSVMGADWSEVR